MAKKCEWRTGVAGALGSLALLAASLATIGWSPQRADAATAIPATAVRAGTEHSLVLRTDGTVWSFGESADGRLGRAPVSTIAPSPTPTPVPGLAGITAIAAGRRHSLTLRSDGTVWAFGSNVFGELGNLVKAPGVGYNPTPTQVPGLTNVTAIAAGWTSHSLALRGDGTVWAFGENNFGQLGLSANSGNTSANPTPTQVPGLTNVIAIAAGWTSHSLALRGDGTVWAFGENNAGQLGNPTNNGNTNPNPTPTQVPGLTNVTAIAAGHDETLALRNDGTVWAFGDNRFGQLGRDTAGASSSVATQVPGLTNVTAIAAGGSHSLVLRTDGTVWAFGYNNYGQLGTTVNNRSTAPNPTPTQIPGLTIVTAIAASGDPGGLGGHSLVVRGDGTVYSFGSNFFGQLGTANGLRSTAPNPTPDRVVGLNKPVAGGVVRVHVSNTPNATVFGNLTVDQPDGGGYTTAYPCADGRPDSSNSNYVSGQTIPNFAAVRSDAAGDVCFFTTASAHLIWDQVAATTAITATNAVRLLDTRG